MKYRVEIADQAKTDLVEIYLWIAEDSPVNAARWVATLESAMRTLDELPERCVIAPEDEDVDEVDLRQLIVDSFRVLFTVREGVVMVLHIRHGSRRTATYGEIAAAIREGQQRQDLE